MADTDIIIVQFFLAIGSRCLNRLEPYKKEVAR